jgi:hypothetical protein
LAFLGAKLEHRLDAIARNELVSAERTQLASAEKNVKFAILRAAVVADFSWIAN